MTDHSNGVHSAETRRLRRERDAARGTIDSIMEALGEGRFTDGLQTADAYVRHTLGTGGHLYHVESYMEICEERDRYREALEQIRRRADGQVTQYARAREQVAEISRAALDETLHTSEEGS